MYWLTYLSFALMILKTNPGWKPYPDSDDPAISPADPDDPASSREFSQPILAAFSWLPILNQIKSLTKPTKSTSHALTQWSSEHDQSFTKMLPLPVASHHGASLWSSLVRSTLSRIIIDFTILKFIQSHGYCTDWDWTWAGQKTAAVCLVFSRTLWRNEEFWGCFETLLILCHCYEMLVMNITQNLPNSFKLSQPFRVNIFDSYMNRVILLHNCL